MFTEKEKAVLEKFSDQLLMTEGEIESFLQKNDMDGSTFSLKNLISEGYVKKVESLGLCYIITKKGMRALKS